MINLLTRKQYKFSPCKKINGRTEQIKSRFNLKLCLDMKMNLELLFNIIMFLLSLSSCKTFCFSVDFFYCLIDFVSFICLIYFLLGINVYNLYDKRYLITKKNEQTLKECVFVSFSALSILFYYLFFVINMHNLPIITIKKNQLN